MSTQLPMNFDLFESIAKAVRPEVIAAAVQAECIEECRAVPQRARRDMHPLIRGVLGETVSSGIEALFRRFDIAEEAIKRYVRRYPDRTHVIDQAFGVLRWELGEPVVDELFRAHCEELLQRVIENKSLEDGTRAEALTALSYTSLRGPLVSQYAALAEKLFLEMFGSEALGGPAMLNEPWPGASQALLDELRQQLRVPSRRLR